MADQRLQHVRGFQHHAQPAPSQARAAAQARAMNLRYANRHQEDSTMHQAPQYATTRKSSSQTASSRPYKKYQVPAPMVAPSIPVPTPPPQVIPAVETVGSNGSGSSFMTAGTSMTQSAGMSNKPYTDPFAGFSYTTADQTHGRPNLQQQQQY
mmetsp:Transcript_31621/g.76764  ORF Transcript_31621/g.76764 Transcript_31621/m.76764 type:complete len:153 (-) Transcript_31621:557-1015(-)